MRLISQLEVRPDRNKYEYISTFQKKLRKEKTFLEQISINLKDNLYIIFMKYRGL
jgi:hypothetical protein